MVVIIIILVSIFAFSVANPPLQIPSNSQSYSHKLPNWSEKIISPEDLLPPSLKPLHYEIKLQPILYPEGGPNEWSAPGSVEITALGVSEINKIVIHRHPDLKINQTSITLSDEFHNSIKVESVEEGSDSHKYGIVLGSNLIIGRKYVLSLKFVADINDGSTGLGLYRAFYTDQNGDVKAEGSPQLNSWSMAPGKYSHV
ncbi:unnamed protein product [Allacma fusca]|uniref:Aminopeptidase N-like N-terminal domain-containing protein n=1 Tax=Allacma fusca TaxID=39272 RepID=A0A8J2P7K7_9HEXA|nr:unnamed protein product [Allacma fusca]